MTVSYQNEVASSTSGGFTRLLFLWRGSLYKLIYRELLLFLVAFALLSALYRNVFTVEQRKFFERAVVYCDSITQLIPLSFVLGFYVTYVADRWWKQYMAIPSPDKLMHSVALYVGSEDEKSRILRRTLMRYINLSLVLVLRSISSSVKRRFPTMAHIVEAGFITKTELEMLSAISRTNLNIYWIPCTWFISLLKDAKNENKIIDKSGLKLIVQEFNEFRSKCGLLWSYDWISIPLVYTQVVTVATYSFFIATLIGRQYINHPQKQLQTEIDIYLPVFTILQFLFYMGLLKVAEQLINPFGEDDEDFELNWLIDRHTKVSYLGVDTLMGKAPPLVKDKYFNDVDITLPYTNAAAPLKRETHRGSTYRMKIPKNQQPMYLPDDKDREKKLQDEKNARNSFPSISSKSNSAYVLQDNISNVDIEQAGEFNKGLAPIQEHQGSNMKSFFRTASIRIANNQYKTFKQRWQRRSFNSAINSYCSMKSMSNSSFETSPENEKNIEDNKESESTKTQRKRSSSGTFVNLTTGNPLSNMDMLSK